jgi:hypothetical protein
MLQALGVFKYMGNRNWEESIYYILILNAFEVLPILVFLKVIVVTVFYARRKTDIASIDDSSVGSLIKGLGIDFDADS